MTSVRYVCALAIPLLLAGCGSQPSEQSSSPSSSATSSSTSAAPVPPVAAVPFRDYLASVNVTAQPLPIADATGLTVDVPVPDGWARAGDPVFATGLEFIRKLGATGDTPSATLMAIKLTGDFDPTEAIKHANVDALPPHSTDVTQSFDDYQGLPSAQTTSVSAGAQYYSRFVIATVPPGQRYLVQLSATTPANTTIAQSPELTSIIDGFTVSTA